MCLTLRSLQAVTYNKQLREQIDNLRRERLMFEAINANLDKELARIKRNIAGRPVCTHEAAGLFKGLGTKEACVAQQHGTLYVACEHQAQAAACASAPQSLVKGL